ncbi:MAG: hypothetical protein U0S36_13125 [Candidatus Nanopelagicales bacterium]
MRLRRAVAAGLVLASSLAPAAAAPASAVGAEDGEPRVQCRISDDRLVEISGMTWSRRHPGVYWVHNDSGGGPYLYAIDGETCRTRARIRIEGIGARDIEAVATGVDPAGRQVLWVGDIGDNIDGWPSVRLVAVREPARLVDQSVGSTTYRFTYPDGSDDAESIIADPSSPKVWVVSKALAAGTVYRVPLSTSRVTTAVRVADVGGLRSDAAMSPDGTRFVIRGYLRADLYAAPVSRASLADPEPVTLPLQRQGEAITFTRDGGALLVAGESEREVWRVPLPGPVPSSPGPSPSVSTPSPGSGSAAATSSPAGGASSPAAAPAGGSTGVPWRAGLAALAVAAAVCVAVLASRRLRR